MLDLQFRDKDKSSARNLTNQDVALMLDPLEQSRDRPSMTHRRSANNHSNCAQIGASSSSSLACIENSSPLSSPSQLVNSTPPTVLEVVGATLSVIVIIMIIQIPPHLQVFLISPWLEAELKVIQL